MYLNNDSGTFLLENYLLLRGGFQCNKCGNKDINFFYHGYDTTNNRMINDNYIVLSKGRDYRDCIIDKGIFNAVHFFLTGYECLRKC